MIVRALRLAELGPFAGGIAIESMSGGLDVLVGPNEAGKSSIFRALLTLVEERHTASSARITRLRHAGGGAPVIEADLDIAGRRLRVRKRYLAQRQASLQDLDTGQMLRGADAENRLDELLSPSGLGPAQRRVLWVGQTESFALPPAAQIEGPLAGLIEREAADTTGAGLARRVAIAIAAALAELQTTHKTPRPKGPLLAARQAHDTALKAVEVAQARAAAASTRRDQLVRLRCEEQELTNAEAVAALRQATATAQRALDDSNRAREQLRITADKLVAARQLEAAAAKSLADLANRITEREALFSAIEVGVTLRAQAQANRDQAASDLAQLEARHVTLARDLDTARQERRARTAADARDKVAELSARAADAEAAETEVARLTATASAATPIHETDVAALRKLDAEIAQHEAEARAGAASIEVAYEPGATVRLDVDGRALSDGELLLAQAPLLITIPGVGKLRIMPGHTSGTDIASTVTDLRTRLTARLAALGAPDITAAEAAFAASTLRTQELTAARARLQALAPAGRETIAREIARLTVLAESVQPSNTLIPPLEEIEQRLSALESARAVLDRDLAAARQVQRATQDALVKCEADLAARRERLATLVAELGSDTATHHAELSSAAAATRVALADIRHEHDEWSTRAPDAIAFARIEVELARAKAAEAGRDARVQATRRSIAEIEGALGRDDADGVGVELIRLEEQASLTAAHLAMLEREAAALSLLAARLDAAQSEHRAAKLRPLAEHLAPLVARMLPDARAELAGLTEIAALIRNDRAEPFAQLSDGTREQIAVLVRLAWARLLTERGQPAPLVLDDALVYSDDERRTRMFALLAEAATRHQVLVLSCHAESTSAAATAVGANLLTIQPWRDEEPRALRA